MPVHINAYVQNLATAKQKVIEATADYDKALAELRAHPDYKPEVEPQEVVPDDAGLATNDRPPAPAAK